MKKLLYIIFAIYIITVLKLTVLRAETLTGYTVNLSRFSDLINVYRTRPLWQFLRLFLGNLGWFAPLGLFLPILTNIKKPIPVCICGLCFSLFIELSQLIFRKGVFEIDDLILNTLGTAIGYAMFRLIKVVKERKSDDEKQSS